MYIFIGERPSNTAAAKGLKWRDGRLAAKQLFDSLEACGIDPKSQRFDNVFGHSNLGPELVCPKAVRRIRRAVASGLRAVAMGNKVSSVLAGLKIDHVRIVHPAARGSIRKKEVYIEHVRRSLIG